ncbi:MAG: hypothetical protein QOH48_1353 [Actinomycetota bacterium]|nr:hypothetical protein [Actinomycetota bacterium]
MVRWSIAVHFIPPGEWEVSGLRIVGPLCVSSLRRGARFFLALSLPGERSRFYALVLVLLVVSFGHLCVLDVLLLDRGGDGVAFVAAIACVRPSPPTAALAATESAIAAFLRLIGTELIHLLSGRRIDVSMRPHLAGDRLRAHLGSPGNQGRSWIRSAGRCASGCCRRSISSLPSRTWSPTLAINPRAGQALRTAVGADRLHP